MPSPTRHYDNDQFVLSCIGQPLEQIVSRFEEAASLHEQVLRQTPVNQAKFVGTEAFSAFAKSMLYFLVLAPGEEPADVAPDDLTKVEPLIANLVDRGVVPPAVGRWLDARAAQTV